MKKRIWIPASIVLVLIIGYLFAGNNARDEKAEIIVPVQVGEFRVEIETSGELEAKNSVPIQGPAALRNFRIFNLTIQSISEIPACGRQACQTIPNNRCFTSFRMTIGFLNRR